MLAICYTEFDFVDILKKFIKGFDLLLFGRTPGDLLSVGSLFYRV